ncbi:MAG: glycosyltransferase [Desulfovibrio sp.]|nr:glycosyltransferase [Desulfovibrio sp.]
MARIAYIDHAFHQKTLSSGFLANMLRQRGHTVDIFWDYSSEGGPGVNLRAFAEYDALVLFQQTGSRMYHFKKIHGNTTFIPMLDSYFDGERYSCSHFLWKNFIGTKIICFSRVLHDICLVSGVASRHYKFFQLPPPKPVAPKEGLHGFFWCRKPTELSWEHIRRLIGDTRFDSFHLHNVPDPGQPAPPLPSAEEITRHTITISSEWFDNKMEFATILRKANIFFAPRLVEGIGQTTLEAMCLGQCVVAPNNGTMNEYILNGLNGLLFTPTNIHSLDFGGAEKLGRNAWESAVEGHRRWRNAESDVVAYILEPPDIRHHDKFGSAHPLYDMCCDLLKNYHQFGTLKHLIKACLRRFEHYKNSRKP